MCFCYFISFYIDIRLIKMYSSVSLINLSNSNYFRFLFNFSNTCIYFHIYFILIYQSCSYQKQIWSFQPCVIVSIKHKRCCGECSGCSSICYKCKEAGDNWAQIELRRIITSPLIALEHNEANAAVLFSYFYAQHPHPHSLSLYGKVAARTFSKVAHAPWRTVSNSSLGRTWRRVNDRNFTPLIDFKVLSIRAGVCKTQSGNLAANAFKTPTIVCDSVHLFSSKAFVFKALNSRAQVARCH